MRISGFTLVRNGVQFEYPFLESLESMLPLCDEVLVNVGNSEDSTLEELLSFASKTSSGEKVRLFESEWSPIQTGEDKTKKNGVTLSEQTNLALERCTGEWCIYLQADEVLHEDDHEAIRDSLHCAHQSPSIEGILFDYTHFYGSYDVVQESRSAYRREVRAFRNFSDIVSVGDAQSFRKKDGRKIDVLRSRARIFHYGWVRSPAAMKEKTFFMDQLYHGAPNPEQASSQTPHTGQNYVYKKFWGLKSYRGSHPKVMKKRIQMKGWSWNLQDSPFVWKWKDMKRIFLDVIEKVFGIRLFEYRSYRERNR